MNKSFIRLSLVLVVCAFPLCGHGQSDGVSRGYIVANLRNGCTGAPMPPPPLGAITIGPNYVMMTVADADPLDFLKAQQFAPDAVFETLMPLYCRLPRVECAPTDRVRWNILTYDAAGNPKMSFSPTSGSEYHELGSCLLTPQEQINHLMVWVEVDVVAGILDPGDADLLTRRLSAALRQLGRGNDKPAIHQINKFLDEADTLVKAGQLPAAAAQTLVQAALELVTRLAQ